jgi:hypothetical protein
VDDGTTAGRIRKMAEPASAPGVGPLRFTKPVTFSVGIQIADLEEERDFLT